MLPADTEPRLEARGGRDPALASILGRRRSELASNLLPSISGWPKYADRIGEGAAREQFIRRELHSFIDYLSLHFRTGDESYKHLYLGEKLKMLHHQGDDPESRRRRSDDLLSHDEETLLGGLEAELTPPQRERLAGVLAEVRHLVLAEGARTLEVLMVGDCLFLDLQAFLQARCLEDDISLNLTFATSKNGGLLRNELRKYPADRFDLVFYSPFTYDFSLPILPYQRLRGALAPASQIRASVDESMKDVEATLGVIATRFECPVLVHNTLNIYRLDGSPISRLKGIATGRSRRIARDLINVRVNEAIARQNAASYEHLFLLDETRTLEHHTEAELSRKFYNSDLQHPAALGRALAEVYADIIAAHVRLAGRKLVVCDLDNTLWDGVIGEGAVSHYHDRQRILQKLKAKGIVLAVNSKNDPAMVHWTGGLLDESDFVALQINWDSKVTNMKRLRESLNLKYKDYVFIDDRGDQLEMVGTSFPEIQLLDATAERSWRLLETWASILPDPRDGDRTQQYHERRAREDFVAEVADEDPSEMFASLGIRVTLREAARSDLQRVVELINRTNQFNCAGSRTTFGEISEWHEDPNYRIAVIEAADKFGQMGIVSVAVIRRGPAGVAIPIFVLSCRVFGYGIETVLLNAVKRLALQPGGGPLPIRGDYRETAHNAPCKSTYPDHGFTWVGEAWIFESTDIPVDPSWLSVEDRLSSVPGTMVGTH
ncbi:HAD-IIIC family phosphatase [Aquisphaera insulae]|uniref:HAD-IIIC family phosphatase n=1 Tax=Aquisphaera insulae TaxID=2712864 RepID=UPI0013EA4E65|nr:HAD-IIIC family phosphatase [Aquisphaera insulae]